MATLPFSLIGEFFIKKAGYKNTQPCGLLITIIYYYIIGSANHIQNINNHTYFYASFVDTTPEAL